MLRHGIPPEIVTALRAVSAGFRAWGSAGGGDQAARPTARELELRDRTLRVLHRPGHSPSDTVFLDESRGLDPARRRPPDRAHLLEPAAGAAARARTSEYSAAGAPARRR